MRPCKETGEKVKVCQEHYGPSMMWQEDLRPDYNVKAECQRFVIHRLVLGFDHETPCRMVEGVLTLKDSE